MTREEYYDNLEKTNELYHFGVGHLKGGHSGRFPWGSGDKNKKKASKKTDANKKDKQKSTSSSSSESSFNKTEVINKGDLNTAFKNFDKFTPKEMENVIKKNTQYKTLKEAVEPSTYSKVKKTLKEVSDVSSSVSNVLRNSISIANSISSIKKK